jgi:LmbE family N-acetylglucosaminyl deacetylase
VVLKAVLPQGSDVSTKILCLGAHCDDIEIGCGGALLRLISELPSVSIWWITLSSTPDRKKEAERAAAAFIEGTSDSNIMIHSFRDGFFPYIGGEIKLVFEELKSLVAPDIIFTHYGGDAHQDHRVVSELTWNTYRDHLILEYEIPKYDGDLGSPNVFFELSRADCEGKIDYLMKYYGSQRAKSWFTNDTFWGLLRLRGIEARATSGYAEAFYSRKLVI